MISAVEIDEMYYGGRARGGRGRPMVGNKQKIPVVGIAQCSRDKKIGKVFAIATPDVKKPYLTSTASGTIGETQGT